MSDTTGNGKEKKSADNSEPRTIDAAICTCEKIVFWHHIKSGVMLVLLLASAFLLYKAFKELEVTSAQLTAVGGGAVADPKTLADFTSKCSIYPFVFLGVFLAVFGILVALYRFHMHEISRNEQIKLGLWRIRIAANNTTPGFQTEVRQSLTKDAFSFNGKGQGEKGKEMESPIPGHPVSELTTTILNKILENMDVTVSKKSK